MTYPQPSIHVLVDAHYQGDVDGRLVEEAASTVLEQEGRLGQAELTIRISGDEEIQELNRLYRGVDAPTDVLSFSPREATGLEDEDYLGFVLPEEVCDQLGDVIISFPRAIAQSREYGHDVRRELAWLVIHGVLQLAGYTHDTPSQEQVMQAREAVALRRLGIVSEPP